MRNKAQNAAKESTAMRKTRAKAKTVKALVTTLAKSIHARNAKSTIQVVNNLQDKILTTVSNTNTSKKS